MKYAEPAAASPMINTIELKMIADGCKRAMLFTDCNGFSASIEGQESLISLNVLFDTLSPW
jgi:hypothetical protein